MGDPVHMLMTIPPKYAVSQVVASLRRQECDSLRSGVWKVSVVALGSLLPN